MDNSPKQIDGEVFLCSQKGKEITGGKSATAKADCPSTLPFSEATVLMDGQKMAVAMTDLGAEKDRNLELYSYEFSYLMDSPSLQQEETSFNGH